MVAHQTNNIYNIHNPVGCLVGPNGPGIGRRTRLDERNRLVYTQPAERIRLDYLFHGGGAMFVVRNTTVRMLRASGMMRNDMDPYVVRLIRYFDLVLEGAAQQRNFAAGVGAAPWLPMMGHMCGVCHRETCPHNGDGRVCPLILCPCCQMYWHTES